MIHDSIGNLLDAKVEALVNAVNTQGVMNRGIAKAFKLAYPHMFEVYKRDCAEGFHVGSVTVYTIRDGSISSLPKYIINFPTKKEWRMPSKLSYIKNTLSALLDAVKSNHIESIAIPALGCGLGGLEWTEVKPLIIEAFNKLPSVKVLLYAPQD